MPAPLSASASCLERLNGGMLSSINPKRALVPLPQVESCQESQHHGHGAAAHGHSPNSSAPLDLGTLCSSICRETPRRGLQPTGTPALLQSRAGRYGNPFARSWMG